MLTCVAYVSAGVLSNLKLVRFVPATASESFCRSRVCEEMVCRSGLWRVVCEGWFVRGCSWIDGLWGSDLGGE